LATFWLRRKVPETSRFLLEVRSDLSAAEAAAVHSLPAGQAAGSTGRTTDVPPPTLPPSALQPQQRRGLALLLSSRHFLLLLVGTAGTWFLLDYAYYGNTISSPLVIDQILGGHVSAFETTLVGFLIVVCAA